MAYSPPCTGTAASALSLSLSLSISLSLSLSLSLSVSLSLSLSISLSLSLSLSLSVSLSLSLSLCVCVCGQVGDNQCLLQSLKDSPYFKGFADKASIWETRLALHQLNQIQRRWVYLEPIFGRGALPREQSRFKRVDGDFRYVYTVQLFLGCPYYSKSPVLLEMFAK